MMKKIYKVYILIIALILFSVSNSYGEEFAPVGTAVAQFLEIGLGARATGMGEAFTVVTDDAGSVFWNPAGLADAGNGNLFTAYNTWPAGISIGGVAFSMKIGRIGTFALSNVYLMTDDMDVTTVLEPEGTGEKFNLTNYSLGISYSRYLTDRVSIGLTTKLVHEDYYSYGYYIWALDLGTIYRTNFHGLKIGMSILHFAPEVRFSGEYIDYSDPLSYSVDPQKPKTFGTYSLPMNFRFGISMNIIESSQHRVTAAADMIHPNNNLEQYNLGIEYCLNKMFSLRSGYKLTTDEGGLSFGAGAKWSIGGISLLVDYAYSDMGVLNDIHRMTLSLSY